MEPGLTLDATCDGRVRVLQRARGYRFTLDPLLLAHFAWEAGLRGPAIDLGAGSGIIPLVLARRFGLRGLTGLEVQPSLFELAVRNVRLNGCQGQVAVALGDLRQVEALFPRGSFAHVISNPPFCPEGDGALSPDPERALARHEVACRIADVARAARWLLGPRGALHLVFPAARLAGLLAALERVQLEPRRLRWIHPRRRRPAERVLVTATAGPGPGLSVAPPLFVHPVRGDGFTPEVRRILGMTGAAPDRTGSGRAGSARSRPDGSGDIRAG